MGSDHITIIRGREGGAYEWRSYQRGQRVDIGRGTFLLADEALPDEVAGKRIGALTFALPASQVVSRVMTLPLEDAEELASAVALQVDKFSPFPVEQMVYSHEVLSRAAGETRVLISISQRAAVMGLGERLRHAGGGVERVDCSALGIWQVLGAHGGLSTERRESILILDDEVILLTHDQGTLLAISGLGKAGNFADAVVCDDLADEVARVVMETDAENGEGQAPCVVLASALPGESLAVLRDALSRCLALPVLDYQGRHFPDAMEGLMLRATETGASGGRLNLTPPEWRSDAAARRFQRAMLMLGGGLLGLWVLLFAGGWGYMAWQRHSLESLLKANERWLIPANEVRSLRAQVGLIERYRDRRQSGLECLREISAILPQGIDLISLTYRKGDGLELVGEADTGDLVLLFNERLNASELFLDIRPGPRTRRQNRHRFSFEIFFQEANR